MSKRFTLLSALACLALFGPAARGQERNAEMPGITVQGTGEVRIKPDIARLSLGVQTQGADSTRAAAENADRTQRVISAIRGAGVAERDIQTQNYSISPQYDYRPRPAGQENVPPPIIGYLVNNTVGVVVRKIADVGKIIDAAIKAGANVAGGILFDLDDPAKARDEAMRKAVANAISKAETLLDAAKGAQAIANPKIRLISLTEGGFSFPRPVMEMANMRAMAADAAPTPVQAGEQVVSATVTARFAIVGP